VTGARELLEAQAWWRRRVVTAYLTGESTGSTRPQLGVVVAGVVLAVGYVATAVVLARVG